LQRRRRNLRAWQAAVELVESIYPLTAAFARDEACGLTSQMRRAANSIPANIAEWVARRLRRVADVAPIRNRAGGVFTLLVALSPSLKRKVA
jgi:hypothetical protein